MKALALVCLTLCGCSCATLPVAEKPPLVAARSTKLVGGPIQIGEREHLEAPIIWACTYDKDRFICMPLAVVVNQICTPAGTPQGAATEKL